MGHQTLALIQQLDAACNSVDELAAATEDAFLAHPDPDIITSFPGLSVLSGACVLAEIGDDRDRFADARAMKAYAGAAPVTRASGRSHVVVARTVENQRLAAAGHMWTFAALRSAEPRAHYDRRHDGGERHTAALRNLFNKLLGCLYHCLRTDTFCNPGRAFRQPRHAGRMTVHGIAGATVKRSADPRAGEVCADDLKRGGCVTAYMDPAVILQAVPAQQSARSRVPAHG
ncbi:transposase [Streptomyces sp. NPDC005820]|uniref:transposase n=1 Tax=Streptomyces sp. NPDC005820 TaxID=3157069 RepID=UPI0033D1B36B